MVYEHYWCEQQTGNMEKASCIQLEHNETVTPSVTGRRIRWRAVNSWVIYSLSLTCLISFGVVIDVVLLANPASVSPSEKNSIQDRDSTAVLLPSEPSRPPNGTLCLYWKQMDLSLNKKVTVCRYQASTKIDIRFFLGQAATIKGIWLTISEWNVLLRLWGPIQTAIAESETASLNGS